AAPGYTMSTQNGATRHDCTTLGGNSGSVVFDLKGGKAVGLHFAGLYQESNFAVRATVLKEYLDGKRGARPAVIETRPSTQAVITSPRPAVAAPDRSTTVTIPISVTVTVGAPIVVAGSAGVTPAGT